MRSNAPSRRQTLTLGTALPDGPAAPPITKTTVPDGRIAGALLGALLLAACSGVLSADQQLWCAMNGERVEGARQAVRAGKLAGLPVRGERLTEDEVACLAAYGAAHP